MGSNVATEGVQGLVEDRLDLLPHDLRRRVHEHEAPLAPGAACLLANGLAGHEPGGPVQPAGEDGAVTQLPRLAREQDEDRLSDLLRHRAVVQERARGAEHQRCVPADQFAKGVVGPVFDVFAHPLEIIRHAFASSMAANLENVTAHSEYTRVPASMTATAPDWHSRPGIDAGLVRRVGSQKSGRYIPS